MNDEAKQENRVSIYVGVCESVCVSMHRLWLLLHSTKHNLIFNPLWHIKTKGETIVSMWLHLCFHMCCKDLKSGFFFSWSL